MEHQTDFYQNVLENLYDGVYFVDVERRVTYWNKGAERISGYASDQVCGHRCADNILMHVDECGNTLCHAGCPLAATIYDGLVREVDVFLHHAGGYRVPVHVRAAPLRGPDGAIIGAVEVFSDNTALITAKQRVEELNTISLTDPLTGIGNRRAIETQLQLALSECDIKQCECGLLFIDLDDFKRVNDSYGHEAGDQVLKIVAQSLRHNVRVSDSAGRWGGDEFIVVLRGIHSEQLAAIASKLRHLIANSQYACGDEQIRVTASIGVALGRAGDSAESLLSRADQLLYHEKKSNTP